jgi:hypothetical protein
MQVCSFTSFFLKKISSSTFVFTTIKKSIRQPWVLHCEHRFSNSHPMHPSLGLPLVVFLWIRYCCVWLMVIDVDRHVSFAFSLWPLCRTSTYILFVYLQLAQNTDSAEKTLMVVSWYPATPAGQYTGFFSSSEQKLYLYRKAVRFYRKFIRFDRNEVWFSHVIMVTYSTPLFMRIRILLL